MFKLLLTLLCLFSISNNPPKIYEDVEVFSLYRSRTSCYVLIVFDNEHPEIASDRTVIVDFYDDNKIIYTLKFKVNKNKTIKHKNIEMTYYSKYKDRIDDRNKVFRRYRISIIGSFDLAEARVLGIDENMKNNVARYRAPRWMKSNIDW